MLQHVEQDRGQYDTPADVLWVSGACLLVRSAVWKALGGLDERFFAHMEEIDLCWRMQLQGWSVSVVPASFVYHIGGGTLPNDSPFKLRLNYRNNLLLLQNNLAATYKAQHGWSDRKCLRKADCLIFLRMVLDGFSALLFLITFRYSSFKAVIEAHREYRKQKRTPDISAQGPANVQGLDRRLMVLRYYLGRRTV